MARRFLLPVLLLLALAAPAAASAASNPADALASTAIDPYRYDRATDCRSKIPAGTLALKNNIIKDNDGPGILMRALKLIVDASGNDLGGNRPGP